MDWFCWENLRENPIFHGKIYMVSCIFSLKPIHWHSNHLSQALYMSSNRAGGTVSILYQCNRLWIEPCMLNRKYVPHRAESNWCHTANINVPLKRVERWLYLFGSGNWLNFPIFCFKSKPQLVLVTSANLMAWISQWSCRLRSLSLPLLVWSSFQKKPSCTLSHQKTDWDFTCKNTYINVIGLNWIKIG